MGAHAKEVKTGVASNLERNWMTGCPEEILTFFRSGGFTLTKLECVGSG